MFWLTPFKGQHTENTIVHFKIDRRKTSTDDKSSAGINCLIHRLLPPSTAMNCAAALCPTACVLLQGTTLEFDTSYHLFHSFQKTVPKWMAPYRRSPGHLRITAADWLPGLSINAGSCWRVFSSLPSTREHRDHFFIFFCAIIPF